MGCSSPVAVNAFGSDEAATSVAAGKNVLHPIEQRLVLAALCPRRVVRKRTHRVGVLRLRRALGQRTLDRLTHRYQAVPFRQQFADPRPAVATNHVVVQALDQGSYHGVGHIGELGDEDAQN